MPSKRFGLLSLAGASLLEFYHAGVLDCSPSGETSMDTLAVLRVATLLHKHGPGWWPLWDWWGPGTLPLTLCILCESPVARDLDLSGVISSKPRSLPVPVQPYR